MSAEIRNIDLKSFQEPIREALVLYSESTNGAAEFGIDAASVLEATPDKPNFARSVTTLSHLGEKAATLYVIAFAPFDGTGDEKTYKLSEVKIDTEKYPLHPKVVPRSKSNIFSEIYLSLASQKIESATSDPVMYAGNLSLLGLVENQVQRINWLGQSDKHFRELIDQNTSTDPTIEFTVNSKSRIYLGTEGRKYGNPHSVFNPHDDIVQVCGFIGVENSAPKKYKDLIDLLYAETYKTNFSHHFNVME